MQLPSHLRGVPGEDPELYDPVRAEAFVRWMDGVFGPGRYLPVTVEGWENVNDHQALLVSNHSGGTTIPDVWGFAWAWVRRFGHERRCHALAHDMVFATGPTARAMASLGVLRAGHLRAKVALALGRDILVCPGGDRDTWRSWSERYQVHFAGRRGYSRLALQTGVPVTPVANAGAHETLVVLADGHRAARLVGLPGLVRAQVWPVHLSIPWGVAVGPVPHIPWPVTLQYLIGAPVPLPVGWVPCEEPPEELVVAYDGAVRRSLQELLHRLQAGRRPVLEEAARGVRRVVRMVASA